MSYGEFLVSEVFSHVPESQQVHKVSLTVSSTEIPEFWSFRQNPVISNLTLNC